MSLTTPQSVRKLQRALYAKAKANPAYRFYALYDKVWRKDVLWYAWGCCRANGGAAGVDGESFEQIESRGVEAWLDGLMEELKTKTYRPGAVRRVYIPEAGWEATAARHSDGKRSGGTDGSSHRA